MTLDKLLGYSAAELTALSDEALLTLFQPYLVYSRPDLAVKPARQSAQRSESSAASQMKAARAKQAAASDMLRMFAEKFPGFTPQAST